MRFQKRRLHTAVGLVISFALVTLNPTAAGAIGPTWTNPPNATAVYYMPGPPPGSYLTACIVDSANVKTPAKDWGEQIVTDDAISDCWWGGVESTFIQGDTWATGLYNEREPYGVAKSYRCVAPCDPYGWAIFVTQHQAQNTHGYPPEWWVTTVW